jgi:chromate transporter
MIYLQLFFEFLKTGLFAVGGGLATLPFLNDMADRTGWFTRAQLADMLAVSESTPGPIGVNMATYVGFTTAGILGAVIATLGLITPSVVIILIVAAFLRAFRNNKYVNSAFYGLRPASTAMVAAAGIGVLLLTLVRTEQPFGLEFFNWPAIALAAVVLVLTRWVKPTRELHPIVFILASAVVGVVLRF